MREGGRKKDEIRDRQTKLEREREREREEEERKMNFDPCLSVEAKRGLYN